MNPLLLPILAQVLDVLIGALTRHPEWELHLGPLIGNILPVLSQVAGETPEQTASRRASAEAIFAKWGTQIVPPVVTP